ncbi:MAG: hypothetical protein PHP08_00840 [Candidatus Dojkabacteria bacterium]|nr:hypothetical protein [Candidatus Dojkabacteria bacterium]
MKTKSIVNVLVMVFIAMAGIVGIVNANEIAYDHSSTFMDVHFNETMGVYYVEVFYINYTTHEKINLGVCYKGNIVCTSDDVWFEFVNDGKVPLVIKGIGAGSEYGNVAFEFNVMPGYKASTKLNSGIYDIWVREYPELKHQVIEVAKSTYPEDYIQPTPDVTPSVNITIVKPINITTPIVNVTSQINKTSVSKYIDPYNPSPGHLWGVDESSPGTPSGFLRFVGRVVGRGVKELGNGIIGGASS